MNILLFLNKIINYIRVIFCCQTKFQYLLEYPKNFKFKKDIPKFENCELIETIDKFCIENNVYKTGAIVSLSGGVDSMVLLNILLHLQKKHPWFEIYTSTIDYGLREESKDESSFIQEYTERYNIKSYVSGVLGVSRKKEDSGSRSEFEEQSRRIRFDSYKLIIEDNNLCPTTGVFVAHHQDDIIENIFTNSMKGGNLLDLEVMKPISKIHDVTMFRPLLKFKKQVIYDFAHKYGIPYFLATLL